MENRDIARILRETAHLLEIDGAFLARYRSYEKAADLIDSLAERIEDLASDRARLTALPGIGDRLAEHLQEILTTGDYSLRKKLLEKFPVTVFELLKLQSLGPKKIAMLWATFQAGTVDAVEKLARDGKLRDLAGFGEKSEQNILKAVEVFKRSSGRYLLSTGERMAEALVAHIRAAGEAVAHITPAGSLRRGKETIGDLDLLLTLAEEHTSQKDIDAISEHILKFPGIDQVLARGGNKVSFLLASGLQVDVRLLEAKSFGAALMYFTGSKEHNVALRGRALKMGLTLNEYALARLGTERRVAGRTEEEIYEKLGLQYIAPELRENCGEIEAAESGELPTLLERQDIRGDLQMHTTASDGRNTMEEMAEAARALGHSYIALTDHTKSLTIANGLDEKRTLQQIARIRAARVPGIRLLAGMEVDILKDGKLDLDDEVLAQLDVVVCSVHSHMNLERAPMTERMLAAIENPYTQIIAHPTGRLLLRREGFDYDMEKILAACKKHGVAMECNSFDDRLDLRDAHLKMAKERGVKVVISTDAHATSHLPLIKYGVTMARRGWLEKGDVLNTLPVDKFLAALRPKPGADAKKTRPAGEATAAEATASASAPRRKQKG